MQITQMPTVIPQAPRAGAGLLPMPEPQEPMPAAPCATSDWTNPAAAAAMRSTADLLRTIEDGILRNFADPDRASQCVNELRSTLDVFATAIDAVRSDASVENDAFLPLMGTAGGGVSHAEVRFSDPSLPETWKFERADIIAGIRRARAISVNVADQLDPRSTRPV